MGLDLDHVTKPAKKLRKLLQKMPSDPTPEEIHSFRTNARKFEATLRTIPIKPGKAFKPLFRLRKRAGKVRDMDVLTSYSMNLSCHGQQKGPEGECSVRLLEHLGAKRRKQATKFCAEADQYSRQLRKNLKSAAFKLAKEATENQRAKNHQVSARATTSAVELLQELAYPPRFTKRNLHPYRLKVKELRNVLRLAGNGKGADQDFIERLGDVKDAIGEWHDWEELLAIAIDLLDHSGCALLGGIKETTDIRFQRAVSVAEQLRKQYIRPSSGRGLSKRHPKLAESVWSATSSLAA